MGPVRVYDSPRMWKIYVNTLWVRSASMIIRDGQFSDNCPGGMEYLPGGYLPDAYALYERGV